LENKKTCIVFGADEVVYVEPDGKKEILEYPPVSGEILNGR